MPPKKPTKKPKRLTVKCSKCTWKGKRQSMDAVRAYPCPKCGSAVLRSHLKQGRPPKRANSITPRINAALDKLPPNHSPNNKRPSATDISKGLIDKATHIINTAAVPPSVAFQSLGISQQLLSQWMQQGRQDKANNKDSLFNLLACEVEKALANAEVSLANRGHRLAEGGKSTWMQPYRHLESYARERWARNEQIEVTVRSESIEAPPDPPKTLEAWVERQAIQRKVSAELQEHAVDTDFNEVNGDQ